MHDQISSVHEIDVLELLTAEVEQRRVEAVDRAILEDVDTWRRGSGLRTLSVGAARQRCGEERTGEPLS